MNRASILLAASLAWAAFAQPSAADTSGAPAQSPNPAAEARYDELQKRVGDRVIALKETFATLEGMRSPVHHEYNVTWVLDDPAQPHGKLNARRAVYGPGGYWFSLKFYRGQWGGAAVFAPIEFGDLKLWFDYGHGGDASVIAAVHAIVKEEQQRFRKMHPYLVKD